jgi:hypothetical protein
MYAEDYKCVIFHNNGLSYNVNITQITGLGIIDDPGNYYGYQTIDSLITSSNILINKFREHLKIKFHKNTNDEYVVVFAGIPGKDLIKTDSFLYNMYPAIFLNSIDYNYLMLSFNYKMKIIPFLLQRIFAGGGTTFGTLNKRSTHFGYGIGTDSFFPDFELQFWLNFSESIIYNEFVQGKFHRYEMSQYFFNGIVYIPLNKNNNLSLGFGAAFYFKQFSIDGKSESVFIQAGIKFPIKE